MIWVNAALRRAGLGCLLAALPLFGAQAAQPQPWEINLQPAATELMGDIHQFHNMLLVIITLICILVFVLLLYVMARYNSRVNPTPSKFTHSTLIEVLWTAVPIAILVVIAIPSFRILYKSETVPQADLTVKVEGLAGWAWNYKYQSDDPQAANAYNFAFDSYMIADSDLKEGQVRLLSVDNPMVVPAGKTVRVLVTSTIDGIIHSWTVPSFGVKMDAVPGRINETWFKVDKPGIYYGQCSELCGVNHAFMPIEVRVVPEEEYVAWTQSMQQQFGRLDDGTVNLAQASQAAGER